MGSVAQDADDIIQPILGHRERDRGETRKQHCEVLLCSPNLTLTLAEPYCIQERRLVKGSEGFLALTEENCGKWHNPCTTLER